VCRVSNSGGDAVSATVFGGGVEVVSTGGTAIDTTLRVNATQRILAGGTAVSTTVLCPGATEYVSSGDWPAAR
jgi:autotransporter passenger strand-loop-strand repeat protein